MFLVRRVCKNALLALTLSQRVTLFCILVSSGTRDWTLSVSNI